MDIYLPIIQEYCYLRKQKNSLYFSASTCEHLWPSPSNLVNCAKCSHNPSKDAADWSIVADFKSLLNFFFLLLKIWFSQTSPFVEICRHENIMVILNVQLWELGTQRLYQGLSETILVNTLIDVREFKKQCKQDKKDGKKIQTYRAYYCWSISKVSWRRSDNHKHQLCFD